MIVEITESKLLCRIRRCSLWTFLVSAFLFLVIQLLETWNAIETINTSSLRHYGEPNGWGKILNSLGIIMTIGLLVLLTLLVAKYAKKPDDKASKPAASRRK